MMVSALTLYMILVIGAPEASEGFLAYKRRRQLRSNAESEVQVDGSASVGAACRSTEQVYLSLCI
ncbi:hypothetical protein SLEP1_g2121 [Rubroshorea leprosula]|uniref:Secreted protein n=1 Tax=Rubroshorea leprosula TaxID=152421 RepID=A0AAV5HLX2_9ROSI|nr:hypothetical protein SLEP1_g2121 [Rubroshorea leprosula]